MLPRTSRRSSSISNRLSRGLLALSMALGPASPAAATCADAGGPEDRSFFSPEIIEDPSSEPFFYSDAAFYNGKTGMVEEYRDSLQAANLEEWAGFFEQKVPREDLAYLLYKMDLPELDGLIFSLKGKEAALRPRAKALREPLSSRKTSAVKALDYLGFAKRVEPLATRRGEREEFEAKEDMPAASDVVARAGELIEGARGRLKDVSDPFLEQRYHFQILRLFFYSDQYERCLAYYEEHKNAFDKEGSVKYRAMDLAAGSLYRQKEFGKANYLYSLIFGRYPALKKSAFRSFHPQEEADWRQTLALARDLREKTVLWQMFGIRADGAAAIEKIYALDPRSALLPLLLVREVNKAEEADKKTPASLLSTVRKIADAGDAYKPYLWELALAHLFAIDGDLRSAQDYLEKASKSIGDNPVLGMQARMSRLYAWVRALAVPVKGLEDYLAKELVWLKTAPNPRAGNLHSWAPSALAKVYAYGRDMVRSMMLSDEPSSDLYQDNAKIDEFISFLGKPEKTSFDRFLAGRFSYDVDQLGELKALNHLYSGRFKEAAEAFGGIDTRAKLKADPFLVHIKDCHDCDFTAPKKTTYTKDSFAKRLHALFREAQGQGEAAARASFELANGLYNMSYFGNARDVYETYHGNFPPELARNREMGPAEQYYRRALELSADREFKARAAFMAAKTEHNRLYASFSPERPYGYDDYFEKRGFPAGDYYKLLKDSYSDTKYYAEILEECGYFKRWAEGKTREP